MANASENTLTSKLSKAGVVLIVLIALLIAYLAPLTVLSRFKDQTGSKRYLFTAISIESVFTVRSAERGTASFTHHLNNPILDKLYRPVLYTAGKDDSPWLGKSAKFILGIQ